MDNGAFGFVLTGSVDNADSPFDWLSASSEVDDDLEREIVLFEGRPSGCRPATAGGATYRRRRPARACLLQP